MSDLLDDENQVAEVFARFVAVEMSDALEPTRQLEDSIEFVRHRFLDRKLYGLRWDNIFLKMGRISLRLKGHLVVPDFCSLLVRKHRAYGAEPLRAWGPLGIVIRIDSKLRRYKNLTEHPEFVAEKEDTLLDILGYCVLGYLLAKE
jgi:hypothetical protein